jgi:cytochrome P450
MSAVAEQELSQVDVSDLSLWESGPPHELFTRLRREAPVHWSPLADYPKECGFWSITRAADIAAISLDFKTFSSERGGVLILDDIGIPLAMQQQQMISMDPPRHDRIKALFQRGFTPRRIAEHEDRIRAIVTRTLDRIGPAGECDLVEDVAGPVVSRVIGSFMGTPEQDDKQGREWANITLGFGDEDLRPGWDAMGKMIEQAWAYTMAMVEERRANPTDDLVSVLANSEVEGDRLTDMEIFVGVGLLGSAGNDSTRAVFTSGMQALMEHPDQRRLLIEEPARIPEAVEECLRCFPAFAHFRRTATCDVELHGQQICEGEKVLLWYVSGNRDEAVYEDPQRFDVTRGPIKHQAFGPGGRHLCLGAALARMELKVLMEETLRRFPDMEISAPPAHARSPFVNQLKTLPVRYSPERA